MSRLFAAVSLVLLSMVGLSGGQDKSAPTPKSRVKGIEVPGYEQRMIEGFYLLVNKKVLTESEAAKDKYAIPPLEVLEGELKALTTILVPKVLDAMRTVRIFVEWDDLPPGQRLSEEEKARGGRVVAVYRSGSQSTVAGQSLAKQLKLNAVEIMTLKTLTEMHQPGRDKDQIILLHELCHTAHHHFFGYGNVDVKKAYQQAMDRDLYPQAYARTSEAEYFAELSSAYLDRCNFFPMTADELKVHDPVGYQLMEKLWGKQEQIRKLRDKARQDREYREKMRARTSNLPAKSASPAAAVSKTNDTKVDVEKVAATKLELARDFLKSGKHDKARERLKGIVTEFPDTDAAKEAKKLLDELK